MEQKHKLHKTLWDLGCLLSLIGIWPRFIEPNLLKVTHHQLVIPGLPEGLHGLKIVQLSDLHIHSAVSSHYLNKIIKTVNAQQPDLLFFTGDFLCAGKLHEPERLRKFLNALKARIGCFASLGNHDYAGKVSISASGDYDLIEENASNIQKGFRHLFQTIKLTKKITQNAQKVAMHKELLELLQQTAFKLLHNQTALVNIKGEYLNICGLGEYMAGRCKPQEAFSSYDERYPGIILSHNPDTAPQLFKYPGNLILCGHTHGGQVNLPWIWKRFTLLENPRFKKGLFKEEGKWIYVNRGIGSMLPFRWFSPPEMLSATLVKETT